MVDRQVDFVATLSRGVVEIVEWDAARKPELTVELTGDAWAGIVLGATTLEAVYRKGELKTDGTRWELVTLSRAFATGHESQSRSHSGEPTPK